MDRGLMLKAASEVSTTWKKFASSEYTTTSYRPYIQITYNDSPPACPQVVSGKVYYIKSNSGDYLNVYNANTADNTRVLKYSFNGNVNQQFKITNVTGGEYEIAPQHTTGKVLSVNASNQVIIESDCNLTRQRWYIFYRNGSYHFVNKQNNTKVMEALYSDNYVYTSNNYDYCDWSIIITPNSEDEDILSLTDLATVTALKRNYIVYKSQHIQMCLNLDPIFNTAVDAYIDPPECVAMLWNIDNIRRKAQYNGLYSFRDALGKCNSLYQYSNGYDPLEGIIQSEIYVGCPPDYSRAVNYALAVGAFAPPPYNTIVSLIGVAVFPPDTLVDVLISALTFAPGTFGVVASLASAVATEQDLIENPRVDPTDIFVRITTWGTSIKYSETAFVRSNLMVRDEAFYNT